MAKYLVEDTSLTTVANAIRTKGDTTEALSFPDGFVSAVEGIQAGGGGDYTNEQIMALIDRSITELSLPKSVTVIGRSAFAYCNKLTKMELHEGIISIGQDAFFGTALLYDKLPDSVVNIGEASLCGIVSSNFTRLPENLETIGAGAFAYSTKIINITLPSKVKNIGKTVFAGCNNLSTVTFEGKPTTIASNVFQGCSNLLIINVPWAEGEVANAPWGATNATINYNYTGG